MIKDINNCREIHFGNGTVGLGVDSTGLIEVIYNKPKSAVGESYNKHSGENTYLLKEKNVCLFFDGEDGKIAIDLLIEDLKKIKDKLQEHNQ